MQNYSIYITFRGESIKGHVQDFTAFQLVSFNAAVVLDNFTGQLEFRGSKYVPGFVRNKEAKDLANLVAAVERQLR